MNKYIFTLLFIIFSILFGYTFSMYIFLPFYKETEFTNAIFLCIFPLLVSVFLGIIRGSGLKMTNREIFLSFIPIYGFKYLRRLYTED